MGCKMVIEIPMFLMFVSVMISAPVTQNFIIYRTCYVILERNETDCARLGVNTTDNATQELEKEVEPISNYISMLLDLVGLIMPCLLCVFIGPWSDKKGRRPILIITQTGFVISNIIKIIIVAIPTLSPWYLFLPTVPILLTGGVPTYIMISFCYLVDMTSAKNRGLRMGILEGVIGLGMLFGTFLSSRLFSLVGYTGVFIICIVLPVIGWLFTIVFLKETINVNPEEECRLFSMVNIKAMCYTTFKKRDGYNRLIVLVCLASLIFYVMAENNSGTESLLLRSKFHWDLDKLTTYSTIRSVIAISGGFFGIYILHTKLRVPETPLIITGLSFCAANTFMMATAEYDWQIYVAATLRVMAAVMSPLVRSLLSKIIPREEIGQVFSFSISMESLIALSAGPLYTIVYTSSIRSFPGAFDLIPFSLHVLNLVLFIFIVILKQRSNTIVYLNIQDDE